MSADVPATVTRKLRRGQPHELDWGVVLRPPTDPSNPGASGAYRWDYYDPPLREDGTRGVRRQYLSAGAFHRMAAGHGQGGRTRSEDADPGDGAPSRHDLR